MERKAFGALVLNTNLSNSYLNRSSICYVLAVIRNIIWNVNHYREARFQTLLCHFQQIQYQVLEYMGFPKK